MKRDMDNLDLRDAFRPMPEETRKALMTAARSVKEEAVVKHVAIRTVCIAACVVVATMAVAMAAGSILGWTWTDFFKSYDDVTVPQIAQEIMKNSEPVSWQVGDIIFTVQERYSDPYLAMISVKAELANGKEGLVCTDDPYAPIGAYGENSEAVAKRIGVDPSMTWAEASKELNLPLYCVMALLDNVEHANGEMMGDPMFNDDNSVLYFSMQPLDGVADTKAIDCKVYLSARKVDVDNPEDESEAQAEYKDLSIDMQPKVATGEYNIPDNTKIQDVFQLKSIQADLTPSGLHFTTVFTALDGATKEQAMDMLSEAMLIQPNGERYPAGISLSHGVRNLDYWPEIYVEQMISVDQIPESIILILSETENTMLKLERKK